MSLWPQELTLRIAAFLKDIAVGTQVTDMPHEDVLNASIFTARVEDDLLKEYTQAHYIV
jgi:hypothetical protein